MTSFEETLTALIVIVLLGCVIALISVFVYVAVVTVRR